MKPIPLTDLEPEWLQHVSPGHHQQCESMADAHGIMFVCPKCYAANSGQRPGVHSIICWFEGKVPDALAPGPGRWTPSGTGFHDLTFVPGKRTRAVSVLLTTGCRWHGHIANGYARD